MKEVERGMVFQNLTEQAEMLYVEVGICDHKYRPQIITTNLTMDTGLNNYPLQNSLYHYQN